MAKGITTPAKYRSSTDVEAAKLMAVTAKGRVVAPMTSKPTTSSRLTSGSKVSGGGKLAGGRQ